MKDSLNGSLEQLGGSLLDDRRVNNALLETSR